MKCKKCGTMLSDEEKFCHECGTCVDNERHFCGECGSEIKEHAKFCSCCGAKVEYDAEKSSENDSVDSDNVEDTLGYKLISRGLAFWDKQDVFCKCLVVAGFVIACVLFVALLAKKWVALVLANFQIGGLILTALPHKNKLKNSCKYLKQIVLAVVLVTTIPTLMCFSLKINNWGHIGKTQTISSCENQDVPEEPELMTAIIPYDAVECIDQAYSTIKQGFYDAGFTNVKLEPVEDLQYGDADKVYTIDAIFVGGMTDFSKGQEVNKSDEVIICYHDYEPCEVTVLVDFIPNWVFNQYDVSLLLNGTTKGTMEHGVDDEFTFTVDPGEYTIAFVSTESDSVKGEVSLMVECDTEASYRILCYSDEISITTVYVDKELELAEGEVKVNTSASDYVYKNYTEVEDSLKALGFTNIKYNILYDIVLGWTENGEVESVSIAGNDDFRRGDVFEADDEIIITYHMPEEDNPANITMTTSSNSYDGQNYLDVQQSFYDIGFANVELGKVTTDNESHNDGEVLYVTIDGWDFENGDIFSPDDVVYIKYYVIDKTEDSSPTYYSTNNYETAKEGDSGVFSYKSTGKNYDIYWMIDFDEGYVYYFVEGEGYETGDRFKIDYGNLNDGVRITYHDGGDVWSYYLHFKYTNHPETLIMVDNDGFEYEYSATDLTRARAILSTKTIKDY